MDVRYLLMLEFVSMMTQKWRGGVKRLWRISQSGVFEMLQTARFPSTRQGQSDLFPPWFPMSKDRIT